MDIIAWGLTFVYLHVSIKYLTLKILCGCLSLTADVCLSDVFFICCLQETEQRNLWSFVWCNTQWSFHLLPWYPLYSCNIFVRRKSWGMLFFLFRLCIRENNWTGRSIGGVINSGGMLDTFLHDYSFNAGCYYFTWVSPKFSSTFKTRLFNKVPKNKNSKMFNKVLKQFNMQCMIKGILTTEK